MSIAAASAPHIDCRGEIVAGDLISFTEDILRRSDFGFHLVGTRAVRALVRKVSTSPRGARTLSLEVVDSTGHEPLVAGSKARRLAAKLNQGNVTRQLWSHEADRAPFAAEARAAAPLAARAAELQREVSRRNALMGDGLDALDALDEYDLPGRREELEALAADLRESEVYIPWPWSPTETGSGGGAA